MQVLIGPDKFKGCLTATEVAEAIAAGVRQALPEASVTLLPVADGGDGTVGAVLAAGATPVSLVVDSYDVVLAELPGPSRTIVAEVSQVGGLRDRQPSRAEARAASSWAAGRLMLGALDLAPDRLVVGIGGTASTDGGAGALVALGARLLDGAGRPVGSGLDGLVDVVSINLSGLDRRLREVEVVLAADVWSPFCGPSGPARVFGPQKGLAEPDIEEADEALRRFAGLLSDAGGLDVASLAGTGAGGGLAGGLAGAVGRAPASGTDVVFSLIGLGDAVRAAQLVITGEGRLDDQSLCGKAPVAVARLARDTGVPCVAVAGSVAADPRALRDEGIVATAALVDLEPDLGRAMRNAPELLRRAAHDLVSRVFPAG